MGHIFGKRPSDLLEISNNTQLALDFDQAAAREVLKFQNKRDLLRLKSLIRSLERLQVGVHGGDVKKLIAQQETEEENQEAEIDPVDPLDDPNVL